MKKATATKKQTSKKAAASKTKTAKEAASPKKQDRGLVLSPRDKKILEAAQNFLLRLYAIPTVSKIAPLEITSLVSALARYPKRTCIPKANINITIKVPCLFTDLKAKYVWHFMYCEHYLIISCTVSFDESSDWVVLFRWVAWHGSKTTFEYNKQVQFDGVDAAYEKSIWEYVMEYDFSKARMELGVDNKGYRSEHVFRVR